MYPDNDFIYDAATHLQACIDMPVVIHAMKQNTLLGIKKFQFIVHARAEIRASNKGIIVAQLKELETTSGKPAILIARFIASAIARELKEKAINYLDVAGNAFIKEGDFTIYVTGQKVPNKEKTNQTRAFQEAGIKLIFSLLFNPGNLQLPYRELASRTGIAIGSVSIVLKELEGLNFILKTGNKRVLKNKLNLYNKWIAAYHDVLRPRLLKRRMRFADKAKYTDWKSLLQNSTGNSVLWGSEPAAALLTNYLNPAIFTLYTAKSWQECAKLYDMVPDEAGDVELLTIFWDQQEEDNATKTVPSVLIYADLINSSIDRNVETAKIIFNNELQHIK